MKMDMQGMFRKMVEKNVSDLHITAYTPMRFRIDERLVPIDDHALNPDEARQVVYSLLTKEQIKKFEEDLELDFSFDVADLARFRVNVYMQRSNVGCAIRLIPYEIMTFEQCGLPVKVVTGLCRKQKGLVLVTGATGSGKSTTLAAMVDLINNERPCHVITIEDPIEFVHKNKKAVVEQREVYRDTRSFGDALKHVLRQDPDVILIGEMRDLETIESALVLAETGHLVLATLHTSDSVQTINRIVDVFPSHQQQQIRTQLSFVLSGIISQQLIPKTQGPGRVLATEIMMATNAVRSLIREGKIHQMYSVIQTSQKDGMQTMDQVLVDLHNSGIISREDAMLRASFPDDVAKALMRR
ncbi:MAG: type IV pilus twitching motility protein PilT [Candidatus Omnitrophota bacterium]